ncbi:MAG: type I DNA topoisomerase [Calditrichaeota bacterium]|nr:MAG: type I DNA topoisomerase [Calditrichota bacterium]
MAKNLLIVESPAKTKTLARFLGKDFDIMATIGHIMDLPKSKLGVDPDNDFTVDYTTIKGKEKVLTDLKKACKKADKIFLAPDPDREGEAIAWHVASAIKNPKADIVRVTFNEITKSAVNDAINNPRDINMNLVNAQQARRVLDRIVGYKVSPFLWKTVARNLSAGRVQSVALRLICEREAEVLAFKPQEYWQVTAELETKKKDKFIARLVKIKDKTLAAPGDKGKTKTYIKSEADVKKHLTAIKKEDFVVSEIKESQKTKKPTAPFITSTLQQEAAKKYGFTAKVTMSIAQQLYEGIEIGKEGQIGLITYMRTDSTRISNEAIGTVRDYITNEYGEEYLPNKPIQYGKKKSSQDAHEAIRPTYMDHSPEKLKKKLTPRQLKIYTLIWNRFVASQMNPAKYKVISVNIDAGDYLFRVSSQKIIFDGFLKVYNVEKEEDESNGNGDSYENLPKLSEKDLLNLLKLNKQQSFTKPPARFSEAMLVKELEAEGIGRPSTYASIISTLKDRKYVELEERRLHPTELGTTVNKILVENFPNIFNVTFTAEMEKDLDLIEEGTDDWIDVMKEFYSPFMETIDSLKGKEKAIKESMEEKTDQKCEKCGSHMVIKWGRNGRFLACSAYPECKSTKPLPEEEARSKTDQKCEKCGSDMVIKSGRFGRFMACSGYPECKNTKPVTMGIKCPKDDCEGEIVEKQTKGRRLFYGCSKYPKCDFASWDTPVKSACPACKHPYMVIKVTKAKGEFYRCPECKHEVTEKPKEEKANA